MKLLEHVNALVSQGTLSEDHALKMFIAQGREARSGRGLGKYEVNGQVVRVQSSSEKFVVVQLDSTEELTSERLRRVAFAVLALADRVDEGVGR